MIDFMYEQDYMLRIIKDLVRALAKIFLNKEVAAYEITDEKKYTHTDYLHKQLLYLIKQEKINEAENLLFEEIEPDNKKYIELALDFYSRLSDLDDKTLEKSNFSREEIEEGLNEIAKKFGAPL